METTIGYHSATKQSYHTGPDMKELVIRLRDEHPQADRRHLLTLLIEKMREDDEWLIVTAEYGLNNMLNNIEKLERQQKPRTRKERAKAQNAIRIKIKDVKEQVSMLGLIMPNGKSMRYCTGPEMVEFGGWQAKIGKATIKAKKKMVGQALNEAEIWKLRG
jgi:hypothetical protein